MQQAAAVDYYGPGLMYALNARAIPKQLFSALGFAGGGSIIGGGGAFSPQTFQMTLALPQLAGLATGLSAATTQLLGMTEAVQLGTQVLPLKEIRSLGKQLDKASVKVADLSAKTQARTAAEEVAARHLDDVKADLKEARADKAKTKSEKAAREKLVASLERQVAKAETAKAAASEKAKAATDKLSEAERAQTDIANDLARAHQQLADDARRAGEALSDAFLRDVENAESLIAELTFGTSSMRDFTGDIEKLRKAGLSEDIIQILIGKGVEVGNVIADGILDGFVFSDAQSVKRSFAYQRLFAIDQSLVCANSLWDRYGAIDAVIGHSPFVTKSDRRDYVDKVRRNCCHVFNRGFEEVRRCKNLSEQLLTVSMAQGFAVLPIHQGEAYPGLKVIPLGDEFTEHAVLAYRQDGMTEALQHFLTFFAGMP